MKEASRPYRRLQRAELEAVEKEFITFLAANSITAQDWERLKAQSPDKAEGLIEVFSGIFWEKALGRLSYLVQRDAKVFRTFHAVDERIDVFEVRIPNEVDFAFNDEEDWAKLSQGKVGLNELRAEIFKGSRQVGEQRNQELYRLVESGAQPCGEGLYRAMEAHFG